MEGYQIDIIKIGTLDIVHLDGHSILLAQINDAGVGNDKMTQLQQNSSLLLNLRMLQLFSLEANSFINIKLAGQFKIVVLSLDFFVLAQTAVDGSKGVFTLFQRQVQLQGLQLFVFSVPKIAIFLQSVDNIIFEFIGNIQLSTIIPKACFLLRTITGNLHNILEQCIEVSLENLLAHG